MPDNEFGYGTVAPAVSAKGNLLNPSAPIASVAMPKVIAPVAPPANAAPSSVQMPNVPTPQISQQQIQQMGDNTTSAVSNMVGNAMPGIIGTGGLALAGYGLSKIPSMLGKGKEEGKAPPESKQGIPVEVEKTQKVEEPKKETKYHLEQDHKELTKEELNKANEVFNTLDNIKTEPTTPKPETPAQQAIKTELKPVETNNPTSPIATTEPNPVVSGEGTSPLHNPEGQGLTQVEATSASATPNAAFPAETNTTKESGNLTNPDKNPTQGGVKQIKKEVTPEKEVKGAAKPRRKPNEIPEGQVFKEGFGGADNWLQSAVGHDIRKFVRDTFNEGKPYGSGEDAMKKAYEHVNKYEQWLKENIPEQTYSRVERKAAGLPPPEIHGPLGTKAKIAGVAGLLMAASQASNAKELRNNLGEALLPLSATPTPVESGKLTSKQLEQYKEYGKLGSPYRQAFLQQTGGK